MDLNFHLPLFFETHQAKVRRYLENVPLHPFRLNLIQNLIRTLNLANFPSEMLRFSKFGFRSTS